VLPPKLEQVLKKLKAHLEQALDAPVRLVLFGSYARGQAAPDSDIDVVTIVPKLSKQTLDTILDVAWEISFEEGVVISLIPIAESELRRLSASPFLQSVEQEGIPL
jgi:predicted nucleotidyltransferase